MVLDAISAGDKNSCMCNGVYDVLVSRFGTHPPPQSQRKAAVKQKQHDRALKRVTRLKNEAQQALRHAKRQGPYFIPFIPWAPLFIYVAQWSLLKAKVPKCCTMCFQASTGRKIDPGLSLMIPAVGDDGFKFLGMLVRVHNNNNDAHASLLENLKRMSAATSNQIFGDMIKSWRC